MGRASAREDAEVNRILSQLPAPDRAYLARHTVSRIGDDNELLVLIGIRAVRAVIVLPGLGAAVATSLGQPWWFGVFGGLGVLALMVTRFLRSRIKVKTAAVIAEAAR